MPSKIKTKTHHKSNKRRKTDDDRQSSEPKGDYEVEKVLNKKTYKGRTYYQLKWVGCDEPTWEKAQHCKCAKLIEEYEKRVKRQSVDEDEDEWEVEKILDKRTTKDGKIEYLVKWKNWDGDHEWISEEDCLCINLIAAFENPKLRKMWNFQGSNRSLWIDSKTIMNYMQSYAAKKKCRINLLELADGFPENEEPLELEEGLNIGPLSYKNHWYLVIILINHNSVCKRLLVGDPLNTLIGSSMIRTHPVFKRLTSVYRRIPAKPLTMTPMDRSDVCGYYLLAAFERALFIYDSRAHFIPEKIYFDCARPELIRAKLKPKTNDEFSVSLPVSCSFLVGPRCEFCNESFEHQSLVDKHIKKEHFS